MELPTLPEEEKTKPIDTLQPIHVDDAQYLSLTRALRPSAAPVVRDSPVDVSGPNAPAVVGEASQSTPGNSHSVAPDQPPGTPIV